MIPAPDRYRCTSTYGHLRCMLIERHPGQRHRNERVIHEKVYPCTHAVTWPNKIAPRVSEFADGPYIDEGPAPLHRDPDAKPLPEHVVASLRESRE